MIDYASEILKQLVAATNQAYNELTYPAAVGEVSSDIAQALSNVSRQQISQWEFPIAYVVEAIKTAVAQVSIIERLSPQESYRRTMAQIAMELSAEVDHRTDEDEHQKYADVSYFIANDPFLVAAAVAAAHIVGTAARSFRVFDGEALEAFIGEELEEGNPFMKPALSALRAAARACDMDGAAIATTD
jgi:hypothetical protein